MGVTTAWGPTFKGLYIGKVDIHCPRTLCLLFWSRYSGIIVWGNFISINRVKRIKKKKNMSPCFWGDLRNYLLLLYLNPLCYFEYVSTSFFKDSFLHTDNLDGFLTCILNVVCSQFCPLWVYWGVAYKFNQCYLELYEFYLIFLLRISDFFHSLKYLNTFLWVSLFVFILAFIFELSGCKNSSTWEAAFILWI